MPNDESEISIELLRGLAHLDLSNLCGRAVPFHALHDGQKWHLWFPGNDRLSHTDKAVAVESCYYAAAPASPDDVHFNFLELIHQRALWPDLMGFVDGIYADLQNAAASLSKLRLIFDNAEKQSMDPARMVVTELEYVFLTCRSIFDLLQEIIVRLWAKVKLLDPTAKKVNLPSTYRKMVLHADVPMKAESIAKRFRLPNEIAVIYANSAPFFVWLRSYRDLIAHRGMTPEYVFRTERGFAISKLARPFRDMAIWTDSNSLPNELGSLLSVIAFLLTTTFATCDLFAAELPKLIQFPPPIAPKHRIFVTGPHLKNLVDLNDLIDAKAWYRPSAKREKA